MVNNNAVVETLIELCWQLCRSVYDIYTPAWPHTSFS